MERQPIFLSCPAYFGHDAAVRCGLPAEVECRYTIRSTGGPLDCAKIRCPRGPHFLPEDAPDDRPGLEKRCHEASEGFHAEQRRPIPTDHTRGRHDSWRLALQRENVLARS